MVRVGGLTHKFYRETRGIKVSGGQVVKAGTLLTREGHRWKPGNNVIGLGHLTAACDGEVYFTKKKGHYKRAVTYIHIRPLGEAKKKTVKKTPVKKAAVKKAVKKKTTKAATKKD